MSTHFTSCIEKRGRTTGAPQTEALQYTPEANGRATPKIAPGSAGMSRWRIPQRHQRFFVLEATQIKFHSFRNLYLRKTVHDQVEFYSNKLKNNLLMLYIKINEKRELFSETCRQRLKVKIRIVKDKHAAVLPNFRMGGRSRNWENLELCQLWARL